MARSSYTLTIGDTSYAVTVHFIGCDIISGSDSIRAFLTKKNFVNLQGRFLITSQLPAEWVSDKNSNINFLFAWTI